MHWRLHWPPAQIAAPFGSVGHTTQAAPQPPGSVSPVQAVPHGWYPLLHVKPHFVPSQVAATALAVTGHGTQRLPHAFTSCVLGHD